MIGEMTSKTVSLGGGVSVDEQSSAEIVVTSKRLALPWRHGSPVLPGTAIEWREELWEVRSVARNGPGERWVLSPWPETEVVRTSDKLDRKRVSDLEAVVAAEERARRTRDFLMPLLPVIGVLPRPIQVRLESEFNLPVRLATVVSAMLEVIAGFLLFFMLRCGAWAPPPALAWIILFAPAMALEGFVRLWFGLTQNEPIGSFVAAPLVLFVRTRRPAGQTMEGYRPKVHKLDPETGVLELISEEPRWDWEVGGILQFREKLYRLIEKSSCEGRSLYLLEPASEEAMVTLSLMPPPRPVWARGRGRGFGAEIIRFMLVAFAPRRVQEVLVADMRLPLRMLTFLSACLEVIGGVVNLFTNSVASPLALFDIALLGEGLYRIVWAVVSRAPVGSLLGLPLRGIYSVWVEEVDGADSSGSPQNGQYRNSLSDGT